MFGKKKQPPIRSLIAPGSDIRGNLKFTDGLRIDGSVHGDIQANTEHPSLLVVSETAVVEGEIHADHVIINGKVIASAAVHQPDQGEARSQGLGPPAQSSSRPAVAVMDQPQGFAQGAIARVVRGQGALVQRRADHHARARQ